MDAARDHLNLKCQCQHCQWQVTVTVARGTWAVNLKFKFPMTHATLPVALEYYTCLSESPQV